MTNMDEMSEELVAAILASQGLKALPEDLQEVTARVNALLAGVFDATKEMDLLEVEPWPAPLLWRGPDGV